MLYLGYTHCCEVSQKDCSEQGYVENVLYGAETAITVIYVTDH